MGSRSRRVLAYGVAAVGPVLLAGAMVPLRDAGFSSGLALVLVLPVVAGVVLGGRGPGVVATVVGAASFDFFLTLPYLSFRIVGVDDVVVTGVLLVVGLVMARLVAGRERSETLAAERAADLDSLHRLAGLGAGGDDIGRLIRDASQELSDLLLVPDVEYRPGPVPEGMVRLCHDKVVVSSGRGGDSRVVAVPVDRADRHLAHFVLRYPSPMLFRVPAHRRAQAMVVADLLGAALERAPRVSSN